MNKSFLKLGVLLIAVFICAVYLSGCNTIQGAGEDVESLGGSIQDAAD